jgi:predicted RNase H-like HicB family nuclease
MQNKYSLIIRWSDEDQCFIAWVPELGTGVKTHGDSYEEAARMGQEVIESFFQPEMKSADEELPKPWTYQDSEADEQTGQALFPGNPHYRPVKTPPKQKIA